MKILIALLALYVGFGSDFQSKEIEDTIQLLGDDKWQVREDAEKKLKGMDCPILYLEKKFNASPDPEVRHRLSHVINSRTFFDYEKRLAIGKKNPQIPSIYQLDPKIRFPIGSSKREIIIWEYEKQLGIIWGIPIMETIQVKGEVVTSYFDLSRIYFDKARRIMNEYSTTVEMGVYRDSDAETMATRLLIKDLIRSGVYTKEECRQLLEDMDSFMIPFAQDNAQERTKWPADPAIKKDPNMPDEPNPDPDGP